MMIEGNRLFATRYAPRYAAMFERMSQPEPAPALVHCTAGKDRTGFAAAVVLRTLGVPEETVYEDFLLTNHYTAAQIERMVWIHPPVSLFRTDPEQVRPVLGVERALPGGRLRRDRAKYGSFDAYRREALGLDDAERRPSASSRSSSAMRELRGRVAVVTGAASGIGRALALELAREGAELALSDVDEAGLAETRARSRGPRRPRQQPARRRRRPRRRASAHAARVLARARPRELVVNNAGVGARRHHRRHVLRRPRLAVRHQLLGRGTRHQVLPAAPRQSGEGHVVNLSSVFGLIAVPGQGAYNAAKFAVRGFTECLRGARARGAPVSATCVHPGGIKTNIARNARVIGARGRTRAARS